MCTVGQKYPVHNWDRMSWACALEDFLFIAGEGLLFETRLSKTSKFSNLRKR